MLLLSRYHHIQNIDNKGNVMKSKAGSQGNFNRHILLLLVVLGMVLGMYGSLPAQGEGEEDGLAVEDEETAITLWSVIESGRTVGFLIIAMSMVSVSFIVTNFLMVRRSRLMPEKLIEDLDEFLKDREYDKALGACEADGSYLAQVIQSGLGQVGSMFGYFEMQNVMQETSEREVAKLYRKLEYLTFIASTAPMMGLLGTVLGMIRSFNQIAITEGAATPSQLAQGISEALVTTCLGLIVAIPTMFFVAYFRNRIENTVTEAETTVEKLMGRFRKESAK